MNSDDARMQRFTVSLRGPRTVYGQGVAASELSTELNLLGASRVVLFASERERKAREAVIEPILGRTVGHVSNVRRHVPVAVAREATDLARRLEADCLVSLGGGSTVGTAKAVALETGLPIIALPTTYAGSDFTPVYGLSDGGAKRTGRSDLVLPRTVLLDPTLTWTLPLDLTKYSAINALAHCVSGVFADGRSPITDLLAAEGARLLARGLRDVADSAEDRAAQACLTQGSYLAGTVLAHAGTSAHHTICHILGGAFDLPHAETHAAVLPAATAFLQEQQPGSAEPLMLALGGPDLAATLAGLFAEVGAAPRLRDLGLAHVDVQRATELLTDRGLHGDIPGLSEARASQLLAEAW